jgi:hypothetical protein
MVLVTLFTSNAFIGAWYYTMLGLRHKRFLLNAIKVRSEIYAIVTAAD